MRKDPFNLNAPARSVKPSDASKTLAPGAQQAIYNAQELARAMGNQSVESVHLLLGALQIEPSNARLSALLQLSGLKANEARLYAQSAMEHQQPLAPDALPRLSEGAKRTLQLAGKEARRSNRALVDVSHLFVACFRPQREPGLAEVLAPLGVSADQLSLHLRQLARGETAKATQRGSPLAQLTAHGERALDAAHAAMRAGFCGRVSTLHLLIGILENPDNDAVAALQRLGINLDELRGRAAVAAVSDGEIAGPERRFTPAAKRALDRAKAAAREGGRRYIGSADLLMGLLPQPLLLIERAQFGARPDDPAAALLRDVDADVVRATFNPRRVATPSQNKHHSVQNAQDARDLRFPVFLALFCIQAGLWNMAYSTKAGRTASMTFISLLVTTMIGSGLITCAMLIFSRSATRKANWQWGFVGTIAGMMAGMAIAGVFK